MKIAALHALEIVDSRGMPTLDCILTLEDGQHVQASVPAGASVGSYEALELRDDDQKRFAGRGVLKAVATIEKVVAPILIGLEPNLLQIDQRLLEIDGTANKAILGANTTLAISCAVAKAQALIEEMELFELIARSAGLEEIELPRPWFNVINGGAHANNNLHIQEFMIIPTKAQSFQEAYEDGRIFFHTLKQVLQEHELMTAVGDEGGFAPFLEDDFAALSLLVETMERVDASRYQFALDVAASQFYDPITNSYQWYGNSIAAQQLQDLYHSLIEQLPICALEDPLAQDDWQAWINLSGELQEKCLLIGDDLCATNLERIAYAQSIDAVQGVIIKPNQVGTLTQALQAIQLCKKFDLMTIISHRSGETEDTWLADFAVGSNAKNIKAGGCSRSERLAKYNRLLHIEQYLAADFSR